MLKVFSVDTYCILVFTCNVIPWKLYSSMLMPLNLCSKDCLGMFWGCFFSVIHASLFCLVIANLMLIISTWEFYNCWEVTTKAVGRICNGIPKSISANSN